MKCCRALDDEAILMATSDLENRVLSLFLCSLQSSPSFRLLFIHQHVCDTDGPCSFREWEDDMTFMTIELVVCRALVSVQNDSRAGAHSLIRHLKCIYIDYL